MSTTAPRTALACALACAACPAADDDRGAQPWTTEATTSSDGSSTVGAELEASSHGDPSDGGSSTAAGTGDTAVGDSTGAPACEPPPPDPPWLEDEIVDVVEHLGGVQPIDGVLLGDRANPQRRALAAGWLQQRFVDLGLDTELHEYGSGTNVIARLPATGASQGTWVLGAHYDSVPGSPGANDNATGVAIVVAAARQLATLPCRSHDVLFVAFDEEELGLVGSGAMAAKLVADREPVVAVHTIDQMGWDEDGDRRVELERADAGLFEFYDDVVDELPAIEGLTPTDTGFTDHVSFRAQGFAAVGLTEEYVSGDTTPHYHQSSDTVDTVMPAYTRSTATLVNLAFARAITPP